MKASRTSPSTLTFAKLLGDGPMARVALDAALATLDGDAFIVSASGTVIRANVAGASRQKRSPDALAAELVRAIEAVGIPRATGAPLVTPLCCEDEKPYFLVIFRPPSTLEESVAYVAKLWGLTRAQRAIVALVAEGFSNKTIAVRLACAERTVESHLTAIFQKSGISGRTALLAAVARKQS